MANYLVCHEGDGTVREYAGDSGDVVWEYEVPLFGREPAGGHGPEAFGNKCFAAVRLPNGDTLISTGNGHSVLEVTPDKKIVWQIGQRDLAGITLAWVTTLEVLPNGHYIIGNCHAGPNNPQLIELDPKTKKSPGRSKTSPPSAMMFLTPLSLIPVRTSVSHGADVAARVPIAKKATLALSPAEPISFSPARPRTAAGWAPYRARSPAGIWQPITLCCCDRSERSSLASENRAVGRASEYVD